MGATHQRLSGAGSIGRDVVSDGNRLIIHMIAMSCALRGGTEARIGSGKLAFVLFFYSTSYFVGFLEGSFTIDLCYRLQCDNDKGSPATPATLERSLPLPRHLVRTVSRMCTYGMNVRMCY